MPRKIVILFSIDALALLLTIVTLWMHGPRTCSDATGYIMGAVTIRHSGEFLWQASDDELRQEGFGYEFKCPKNSLDLNEYRRDKAQGYQTHWSVGYPFAAVCLNAITRLNLKYSFCLLNTLCILATFLCVLAFCRTYAKAIAPEAILLFSIVFSSFLWLISMVAFSEVLFMPMSLCAMYALDCHLRRKSLLALGISAIICGACILIRYAGLYLVPAAMFCLIYGGDSKKDAPLSQSADKPMCIYGRMALSCLYAMLAILPFCVWQVRNYLVSGAMRGGRISQTNFIARLIELLALPASTFFPIPPQIQGNMHALLLKLLCSLSAFIILALILVLFLKNKGKTGTVLPISAFAYIVFICLTNAITGEPYPLNYRIMLPFLFPLCIFCCLNLKTDNAPRIALWSLRGLLAASFLWTHLYLFAFLAKNILCSLQYH